MDGVVDVATAPTRRWSLPRPAATPLAFTSADGTALHADVYAPRAEAAGTVVLAHGYRDGRTQLAFLARPLVARGYRVVALDFRAHGRSGGDRVTIGVREADDVRAVLDVARRSCGRSRPLGFLGYSMGASAYLLGGVEADAAVLDSPYDTLREAIAARARRVGLGEKFARELEVASARRFGLPVAQTRPIDSVARLQRPTLFVFARHDPWIGKEARDAFARALPASASMRVVLGGHRLHFGPSWRETVVGFLAERLSQR